MLSTWRVPTGSLGGGGGEALRAALWLRAGVGHADDGGVTNLLQLVGRLRRGLGRDYHAGRVVVGGVNGKRIVGEHFVAVIRVVGGRCGGGDDRRRGLGGLV